MHKPECFLYESGELEREASQEFESHLSSCNECAIRLETARRAHHWTDALMEEPSPVLLASVLEAKEEPTPRTLWALLRPVSLAAGFASLAFTLYFVGTRSESPQWDSSELIAGIISTQQEIDRFKIEVSAAQEMVDIGASIE